MAKLIKRQNSTYHIDMVRIRADWELQYNKDHVVEAVKVGETDLVKDVNSHADEVGLVNAMRLAIAHGEDPYTKFGKYEDGIPAALDPNATLDEINEALQNTTKKYEQIAASLGVSVVELQAALKTEGGFEKLIAAANKPADEAEKEGE